MNCSFDSRSTENSPGPVPVTRILVLIEHIPMYMRSTEGSEGAFWEMRRYLIQVVRPLSFFSRSLQLHCR